MKPEEIAERLEVLGQARLYFTPAVIETVLEGAELARAFGTMRKALEVAAQRIAEADGKPFLFCARCKELWEEHSPERCEVAAALKCAAAVAGP